MISQTVTNDIPLFWPHQLVQSCGNHEDELLRPLSMEGWLSEDSNIVPLCLLSCMYPGCVSHGYSQPVYEHDGVLSMVWHGTPQPADVGPRTPPWLAEATWDLTWSLRLFYFTRVRHVHVKAFPTFPDSLFFSFFGGHCPQSIPCRFSFDRMFASWKDFLDGTSGKEPACWCRRHKRRGFDPWVRTIPLEEGMATHSSILAWRSLWTEELGRLWSIEPQRVQRHNWSDLACTHCFLNTWSNKRTHSQMFPGGVSQMGGWGLQTAALWEPCGAKATNIGV